MLVSNYSDNDAITFVVNSANNFSTMQFSQYGNGSILDSTSATNGFSDAIFPTTALFFSPFVNGTVQSIVSRPAVTVTNLSAVPEPATWAMFIGGFGLIGGSMRRKRQNISVAFA